jgi:sugar lactone lactonase YvrE
VRLLQVVAAGAVFSFCAAAQTNTISQFAGSAVLGPGYSGDAGPAIDAQLNSPYSTAVDSSGNVYIADFGNYVVRKVSPAGTITTFAGTGTSGTSGVGGYATSAQLMGPTALAADSSGNIYIADGPGNRVLKVLTSGIIVQFAGSATASSLGDGGPATSALLNYPFALAVDASGNIYIADTGNHRVRKVAGGVITTVAGNGTLGFTGDSGPATAAMLNAPQGVTVDSSGNIYISDTGNQRIREVSSGVIQTIAGSGTPGYSGDKGPATAATVKNPHGLAVDPFGALYVADTGNNVVRKIAGSLISTVAGTGVAGFTVDGGAATSSPLNGPYGVGLDPTGADLYIADTGNNEVRLVTLPIFTGVIPHVAAGSTYSTGFYVVNKSGTAATVSLSAYNDSGAVIALPYNSATLPSTVQETATGITDTIPAYGSAYYEAGDPTNPTLVSGSVFIQSNSSIVVQALFRHLSPAGVYYEAAVPSSSGSYEVEMAFDDTTFPPTGVQIVTGIGIANIDPDNPATITCTARNNSGTTIAGAVSIPVLAPQGHYAAYNFPALVGQRGTLDCVSTTKIGAIALRFLGTDGLSSLPVIQK